MDRQSGFLFVLLFLANFLTIRAEDYGKVMYIGQSNAFTDGSWIISCSGFRNKDMVSWTRNMQSIEPEIEKGEVKLFLNDSYSSISTDNVTKAHSGTYKCVPDLNIGHTLQVIDDTEHVSTPSTEPVDILIPNGPNYLTCMVNSTGPIQWQRNNAPLSDHELYHITDNGRRLYFNKTVEAALGNYTCKGNESNVEVVTYFRVVAKPTIKLPADASVVEGEKLHLVCEVSEIYGPKIMWKFGNKIYTSSSGRVKLSRDGDKKIDGAVLIVENIQMTDAGNVTCMVNFNHVRGGSYDEATTFLRVKDKLAALWPFLGICIEVIVLCAIILLYEKKRNKAELDESDTDQSPDTKRISTGEEYYIPLQGPLPPSVLPVQQPLTQPPNYNQQDYKAFRRNQSSQSQDPPRNLTLKSDPPLLFHSNKNPTA